MFFIYNDLRGGQGLILAISVNILFNLFKGSFDPVTYGHLDIMKRSSKIVDELVVGVLNNNAKMPLFSVAERVKMLKEVTTGFDNIVIVPFEGLLVDF